MLFQLEKTKLAQIAVPLPVEDPFTYLVPDPWIEQIQPGMRVLVPFKNREIVGTVVGTSHDIPNEKTKKIISLLDTEPILSESLLALTRRMSFYYFSSWGEAIQAALPKFYRQKKQTQHRKQTIIEINQPVPAEIHLNSEQKMAVEKIVALLRTGESHSILLFGVTASGKTEIYIRVIKETIRLGKSVICLVPEIALTEQMERFFESHFGPQLEIVHSKLSEGERWQAWQRIQKGEKQVVLGARSAIFSPVKNLGLIVIDEEQEPSYKQDQTPRYHAREVAKWRAQNEKAILLMGTATPSLETWHEAIEGKIHQIELTKRVTEKKLPTVEIVDLNQAQQIAKDRIIISQKLESTIHMALEKKEGVLLLLNRRGFSTQMQCLKCGRPITCRYCDVSLTYHQQDQKLICHYCNFKMEDSTRCPYCSHTLFKSMGIGTEKVESEVARLFPTARVARLDSDSTSRRGSHQTILSQFRDRQIDILVGTQMIAKGFDFSHVTVVGVILADTALVLPDYRSSEKTFQLLTQVAGRSGRGKVEGKVIIQTYSPLHYSIQHAKNHAVRHFFDEEINHRRHFSYPPFVQLVNIMLRGKIEKNVVTQAFTLKKILDDQPADDSIEIIGPAPLPFSKLRGNYRWHIMLKSKAGEGVVNHFLRNALKQVKKTSYVHIAIDVDPIAIL